MNDFGYKRTNTASPNRKTMEYTQNAGDAGSESKSPQAALHHRGHPSEEDTLLKKTTKDLECSRRLLQYFAKCYRRLKDKLDHERLTVRRLDERTQKLVNRVATQDATIQKLKRKHRKELKSVKREARDHVHALSKEIDRLQRELDNTRQAVARPKIVTREQEVTDTTSCCQAVESTRIQHDEDLAAKKSAATRIQNLTRVVLARKVVQRKRRDTAALRIQSLYRKHAAARVFSDKRKVAIWLQTRERGRRGRRLAIREKLYKRAQMDAPLPTVEELVQVETTLENAVNNTRESKAEIAALVQSLGRVMQVASDFSKPCELELSELVALDDLMANVIDHTIEGRLELEELITGLAILE